MQSLTPLKSDQNLHLFKKGKKTIQKFPLNLGEEKQQQQIYFTYPFFLLLQGR